MCHGSSSHNNATRFQHLTKCDGGELRRIMNRQRHVVCGAAGRQRAEDAELLRASALSNPNDGCDPSAEVRASFSTV